MWPSLQGNFAVAVCISLCHSTKFLAVMQLGSPGVCLCRTSYSVTLLDMIMIFLSMEDNLGRSTSLS